MSTQSSVRLPSKPPVPVVCQHCGGTLLCPPSLASRRKYCSRDCYAAALRRQAQNGLLPIVRPGSASWKTPESRARSLANLRPGGNPSRAKAWWDNTEMCWYTCVACGEQFPSRAPNKPRYCSRRCYMRAYMRRASASVPDTCAVCGVSFQNDRWEPRRACSPQCTTALRSPLSWDDVRAMRRAYHEDWVEIPALAAQYSVAVSTVHKIVHNRRWKEHMRDDPSPERGAEFALWHQDRG